MLRVLVAVHLRGGWHRQYPRGNKEGVDALRSTDDVLDLYDNGLPASL